MKSFKENEQEQEIDREGVFLNGCKILIGLTIPFMIVAGIVS